MTKFNGVQYGGVFNALDYDPIASVAKPVLAEGWYDALIVDSIAKPTKSGKSAMLQLTYSVHNSETATQGTITHNFNLWNENEDAIQIAHGQLSGVCHATGVYQLNLGTAAKELIGARFKVYIIVKEALSTRPNAKAGETFKSNEISMIADVNGNPPIAGVRQQTTQAPQTQPSTGGWTQQGNQPNNQQAAPQGSQPNWTQQQQQQGGQSSAAPNPQQGQPNTMQSGPSWAQQQGGQPQQGNMPWNR